MPADVFCGETDKSIATFIGDLGKSMMMEGYIIHNENKMEMVRHFGHHGVELAERLDLHMVQICAPKKSAQSLLKNFERAVLLPKHIVVFNKNCKTQVRMLRIGKQLVADLVEDDEFPDINEEVCDRLTVAIEEAL